LIRVPVNGIRIASRATKGVTIFSTAAGEKVVSVERISEPEDEEGVETEVEAGAEESGTPESEGPAQD
jgi:DNA gyrase subunit A